jgi:2-polyprenyl-3-methyl-5-hydroxy-6-metoxy-1,4-benzoquinol methylase
MKTGLRSFLLRLKSAILKPEALSDSVGADIQQKLAPLDAMSSLVRTVEERSRTLESLVRTVEERSQTLESLVRTVEERSQTLEYLARQSIFAENYQIEQLHQLYVESMPQVLGLDQRAVFNATSILELKTDFPIAVGSNDHINPDSTMEGVTRPTLFVQNCISVLGTEIKCLDLGSGAAGLVYEFAMNQILAIGVDGSDFCRINRIGYWPLLSKNLFTCDITKPFSFLSRDTKKQINFDVITMWEVLEHVAECDIPSLFRNIRHHLSGNGFFIGSISLVEYVDSVGNPYHVTIKPRDWWKSKFIEGGLVMLDAHPFNEQLFCRGSGPRFQDFHNYALNPNDGFLFVAQKISDSELISA